jgi:valyl-tRNA synthetase
MLAAPANTFIHSGEATGPVTGHPPPTSDETKAALLDAANSDATGQNAPGPDSREQDTGKKVKSEKEREDPISSDTAAKRQ